MGRIGGHRGLDVIRKAADPGTVIIKQALHELGNQGVLVGVDLYGLNETAVHNEAVMLDEMLDSGYTPTLIDIHEGMIIQSDVGMMDSARDMEAWRRNCVRMLATIRSRGLRHGDLRGTNIITVDDWPWVVDWQESHYIGDVPPQKQPWTDSNLLMQHIEGTPGPNGQFDTPRVARRWRCLLDSLGASTNFTLPLKDKLFLDLGCFQGDFVALAAAEGMHAVGIDRGGFRTGEDSIEIGTRLWAGFPYGTIDLRSADLLDVSNIYNSDVVVMFSTWAYVVKDYGRRQADDLLRAIIAAAGVFFFETQLAGDGPGPDFLPDNAAVATMLTGCGATMAKPIATFPVTGRPAHRTVWRVQR